MNDVRYTALLATALIVWTPGVAGQQGPPLPPGPLKFAAFSAQFRGDGIFALQGPGWPTLKGTWKRDGGEVEILTPEAAGGCDKAGPYRITVDQDMGHVAFALLSDACTPRLTILARSLRRPPG